MATDDPSYNRIGQLPSEEQMERVDALDAFLSIINIVQPDHPYKPSPYPLSREDVDYGVTRTMFASCGPSRRKSKYTAQYNTRMTFINKCSRERHLAVLVHEVTHVSIGRHSSKQHGNHPPRFWKNMAFNAVLVHDSLTDGVLADVFPNTDVESFEKEVFDDPNPRTVDQRYWTVDECKKEMQDIISYCLSYEHSYDYLPEANY